MKLKKIVLACAAALALPMSMSAHAVAPTGPFDNVGVLQVFLSGASAPDNFLATNLAGLLKPGFFSYTVTGNSNYRAFLGETIATAPAGSVGFPTNQKILFIKRSEGGSVFGVNPIGLNDPIKTMVRSLATDAANTSSICTAVGTTVTCTSAAVVGIDPGFTGAPGAAIPADFGVSDVAPFMFKEPFNVEYSQLLGGPAPQLSSTSNLTIRSVNTLAMGIVTTKDVPDSLVISKADYHAMLTGSVVDWNTFGAGINTATDTKTNVVVCRRVPGSGTQTSYNWYFNNFPCTVNSLTSGVSGNSTPSRMTDSAGYFGFTLGTGDGSSAANAIGVDVTAGYTVIENSGSGNVRSCLTAAANNLVYTFQDEAGLHHNVNFNAVPAGHTATTGWRAVGVLSLDSQTNTALAGPVLPGTGGSESAWFFRALDGNGRFYQNGQTCLVGANITGPNAAPTGGTPASGTCPNRANLRTGKYDFAAELTMQYRTGTLGAKQGFVDAFITRAGDPSFQALWTMALPGGAVAPDGVNAVSFASRQLGNQCRPLVRQP